MGSRMRIWLKRLPLPTTSLPWGLVGACLAIVVIESGLSRHALNHSRPEGLEWRLSGQAAARGLTRGAVLCFGSSMTKQGLNPWVMQETLERPVLNLALCGGPAPASYFLLKRVLQSSSVPPAAVVVEYQPAGLAVSHRHFTSNWPHLLGFSELANLAWHAHDPSFLAESIVARSLTSVRDRHEIRDAIQAQLLTRPTSYRRNQLALARNVVANRGAKLIPPNPNFHGEIPPHLRQELLSNHWECTDENLTYIEKFLDLANKHNIPVFWLLPPFAPALQAEREHAGLDARYRRFVRTWQERYPGLVVLEALRSGYDNSVFVDSVHLDRNGSLALSADVAEAIARNLELPRPAQTPRSDLWHTLVHYKPLPEPLPLEDFARSAAIVIERESRHR